MSSRYKFFGGIALVILCLGTTTRQEKDSRFLSFVTEPSDITFYWKDDKGEIIRSIQNLKTFVETKNKELKFAMNGGMYTKDNSPQGLFIENGIALTSLDTLSGSGNFYLKPNGVFYLMKNNEAFICQTKTFVDNGQIKFATQSGPMLLVDGQIHPAFMKGSPNLNIRNGVGILPDNRVVFVMSKQEVNFYDFAEFFKSMNCKNALYLDGFVSRTYLPEENWKQLDGNFGVIIGVEKD
ncbi:MAG: phosphodiester glycosidase family protein [Chryseolinea sp.]